MRWLWITLIVASLSPALACQDNASTNSGATAPDAVAADLTGTDLVAELNHSVNAKKAKLGDVVKATLTQDVLLRGRIVIRRGSQLVGHVTQTKAWSKDDQDSRLGLVFDKAVLKGGGEIDFVASLRALAPGVREDLVDKPDPMLPPILGAGQPNTPPAINSGSSTRNRSSSTSSNSTTSGNTTNQASQAAQMSAATPVATNAGNSSNFGIMGGGSRGVFGMPGLHLTADSADRRGSILSSTTHTVKLDSGTQMVIQVNNVPR